MKALFSFIILISHCTILLGQNELNRISIGHRSQIVSSYLGEEREFQVYLPSTYCFNEISTYPVIYLLDGDYNFHYVTGLVELASSVSGKMPECVVVGISDKGASKYKRNCTPTNLKNGTKGNAGNFMRFISDELKPYIDSVYRTANYNVIIGHSVGGLFVTNFFLQKPDDFDAYIAIDPALWVGEYEMANQADSVYRTMKSISSLFYISSSNIPDMGIDKYVSVLEKYFPKNKKWKYFNLNMENHNSVGLPTIKKSFEDIFNGWSISKEQFISFESANEVIAHYRELSDRYSVSISIHPYFLSNIIYYYTSRGREEDLLILEEGINKYFPASVGEFYYQLANVHYENNSYQRAIDNYNKSIAFNSSLFYALNGIAKVFLAQKEYEKALNNSLRSIEIAEKCNARQWMLNQLYSTLEDIENEM
ncbi:alpha/beta hydrolase-fold protein [Reichenbachiella versicolor]|uniref:alpha/beta hydrolase-fold protein n=1 Tax=Reichenbachiella versicolor TaxID=1821036 RepID=UPI0013A56264|nr:alpha/beta hydrolase-fold protein [Reichenbachiella versicolor]